MDFPNKTASYMYSISLTLFLCGSPNYWIEDLKLSKSFVKRYRYFSKFINLIILLFIIFEVGAFVTQKNLSKKQQTDLLIYGISHPILYYYSVLMWNRVREVQNLFSHILYVKSIYNSESVEKQMLKKLKWNARALVISFIMSLFLNTANALSQVFKSDGTFTTVITSWPLVDEKSTGADVVRVISYLIWWVFITRISASFIIVITLTTTMSYQYVNLQSYFYSIADIFENPRLTQLKKERDYIQAFKVGIKLHSDTMDCLNQFRNICKRILSVQIVFVIMLLVFLMTQMMKSERTMGNAATTAITTIAVLISTGFFFWNAGDITEEASKVSTAMYFSGWHNCQSSSRCIRKLVVIAMNHAQRPVLIKGLGVMTLSYQSFVSLVKSSYSVFSVIY